MIHTASQKVFLMENEDSKSDSDTPAKVEEDKMTEAENLTIEKTTEEPQTQIEDHSNEKKTSTSFKATRKNLQLPRRIFHIANGSIIATLYLFYVEHSFVVHTIGIGVCLFYIFEQLRVKYPEYADSFSIISSYFYRAEEQLKESAMIPYAMGLLLTILSFPKIIAVIAIFTLAISDPLSAIIGIKFGKHPFLENKTYEGSGAFFITSFLCMFLPFHFVLGLVIVKNLMFCFIWALLVTAFEALPSRVDDNLTIPLVTATLGWIIASLWNIPLTS
jgi:dolichol kinase